MTDPFKLPELRYGGGQALLPQRDDLSRLYRLITESFATTVLEFGCGYSTFVISHAMEYNRIRWEGLENKPKARNTRMFKGYSVDTNDLWLDEIYDKLPYANIILKQSPCQAGAYNGQLCHYYVKMPNVVPDFIYLDGPDPAQVEGTYNGFGWRHCPERTPMAADILLMESTLLPGTQVLIDGRTNNARFLIRNLKRQWEINPYPDGGDYTHLILNERRLGRINVTGRDICEAFQESN